MHINTSEQASLRLGFGEYTCNWGTHIAGLFESEAERDDILLGFLSEGGLSGDLQLFCSVGTDHNEFKRKISRHCPACASLLDDPDYFELSAARDLYYPDGTFSPWAMDNGLNAFFDKAQESGLRHIRATAEMEWALEAIPGVEHLMAYEARLNYFIPGKPWISICLYSLTKFSGAVIMDVLRTHPYTISGGVITENPYYQDPAYWLAENAPEFLAAG